MHRQQEYAGTDLIQRRPPAPWCATPGHAAVDPPISVLKFGSSVLRSDPSLANVVGEIYHELRLGRRVFAVVSAFPGLTDLLRNSAIRRFPSPDPACLASLLATGETASAALLGMALEDAGIPAVVLDPGQAGFRADGPLLDATPVSLDVPRVRRILRRNSVVVFPGFFGRSSTGSIALLGRGGSDLTAVFCAHALGARSCRLIKDVDGVYSTDPKSGVRGERYERLTWEDAAGVAGRSVQARALQFARRHRLEFEVGAGFPDRSTLVGDGPSCTDASAAPCGTLRVALFGLGEVGLEVYRRLAANPERFQVVGIAVRDSGKPRDPRVPRELLHYDPGNLLEVPSDVVVELVGGLEPGASVIRAALESGRDVVTANKAVLARQGGFFETIAGSRGRLLACSASVGGGVPVLETLGALTREGTIERISAVLNGTCNCVLDRLAEGVETGDAIREAQALGFAEADPSLDLSGADSADKLAVIAWTVFRCNLDPASFKIRGIDSSTARKVREARGRGRALRLVASLTRTATGFSAAVRPLELPPNHPLAGTRGPENRILVTVDGRSLLLRGKGAGGKTTSLSVFADLLDVWCRRSAVQPE